MAELDFEVEIAAPPARVWAFFVPQRMPLWYGAEMESEFEVQGGAADFETGQKVRITGRMAGREVTLTAVLTRYEWGRVLEWRFQDAYGIKGLQRWELEPNGAGTHLRMREEYALPTNGFLARSLNALVMKRNVSRRDKLFLSRLKHLAEGAPGKERKR